MTNALQSSGYNVRTYRFQPGLASAIPEGNNGSISIFGDIPEGWKISDILSVLSLDLDGIETDTRLTITIPPPGRFIDVVIIQGNLVHNQRITLLGRVTLISDLTTRATNKALNWKKGEGITSDDGNNGAMY